MVMVEKAVEENIVALYALIDLGQIFRETKPNYRLNNEPSEKNKRDCRPCKAKFRHHREGANINV
ncbi:hypothetical protein KAS14_03490 [Candidatus Bathyarchaeota archaeon]|nr:hypothetical protein [Candidatus Bathyarchaeota archaeon]